MSEQALGWFPLGLGLVVEDEPSELSYTFLYFSFELGNICTVLPLIVAIFPSYV